MRCLETTTLFVAVSVTISAFCASNSARADVKVEDPGRSFEQGLRYMADEKWNLAVEQLEHSIAIKNDDARVWLALGDALVVDPRGVRYASADRNERAAAAYLRSVDLDPTSSAAWNNLAWLRAKTRTDLDQGLAAARRAVEINESAGHLDTLAEVHHARGEHREALAVIEQALETEAGNEYFERQRARFAEALASPDAGRTVRPAAVPGRKPLARTPKPDANKAKTPGNAPVKKKATPKPTARPAGQSR